MASATTGGRSRGATVLSTVVIAFLLATAAYLGAVWLESARMLAGMSELEDELSETVRHVSTDTVEFQGDPESASVLVLSVREAGAELVDIASEAERLRVPPPPARSPANRYRDALLEYIGITADYYVRLKSVATVVVERAEVIEALSDGLGVLTELSDPEAAIEDIERVIAQARTTVEEAVDAVEQVSTVAGPSAYSSDALLGRLRGLAGALSEIEASLRTEDPARVSAASETFSRLIALEWGPLFFEASQEGVDSVVGDIEGLVSARADIDASRASLDQMRGRLAFFAIALTVVAVLLMAVVWFG